MGIKGRHRTVEWPSPCFRRKRPRLAHIAVVLNKVEFTRHRAPFLTLKFITTPMRIQPKLFDWDNPKGLQWVQPDLSQSELNELAEAMVMFMGHDPASPHRATVLGSGFIVGVADTLIVATASHIFTWWTDKLRPAKPHALRGLTGDREDMKRRLQSVVQDDTIAASVNPKGALTGLTLSIVGLAINSDPRELDVGFVQLAIPPGLNRG
jgi:hypothetical protein